MKIKPEELKSTEITEETEIHFKAENRIEGLKEAVRHLTDKTSWIKNIQITNKKEERERFKQSRDEKQHYHPEFKFKKTNDTQPLYSLLEQCREASQNISKEEMKKYGAEKLSAEDMQQFFSKIISELELYLELSENIEDEESWREYSEKIWPMIDEETYRDSIEKLEEMDKPEEKEKTLDGEDLKEMFEEEVKRLGMDYSVELREVEGCFNIPEEQTVVAANGSSDDKRKYSKQEAEMLTKHELFHALRAYNGYKAGEESGFPPILGIHTPFYDQTEEGGALYREQKTNTNYAEKDFDYHLRLVAAYKIAESDNYGENFKDIVEKLIDLGGSVDRSFYLVARNREALRHHIYLKGVSEWSERDEVWPLLIGKINSEYAEKFREEVEAGGMLKEPEISLEKVFETGF
jgi:hypothetical protein